MAHCHLSQEEKEMLIQGFDPDEFDFSHKVSMFFGDIRRLEIDAIVSDDSNGGEYWKILKIIYNHYQTCMDENFWS